MSSELKQYLSTNHVLICLLLLINLCQHSPRACGMILNLAMVYYLQVPRGCVSNSVSSEINPKQGRMIFFKSKLNQ